MSELHQERQPSDNPEDDGYKSYVYQYIEITVQPGGVLNLSAVKHDQTNPPVSENNSADETSPS